MRIDPQKIQMNNIISPSAMEQINNLRLPTRDDIINTITSASAIEAMFLVICGVIYLIYGWRAFKVLIIANAAILGAIGGSFAAAAMQKEMYWPYAAIGGAVIAGIIAWPLLKIIVCMMGSLAGGIFGGILMQYLTTTFGWHEAAGYSWAGSAAGAIIMCTLTFVVFRVLVILFTSLQGASMLFIGANAILLKTGQLHDKILDQLTGNLHYIPLTILVLTAAGFLAQTLITETKPSPKQ